MLNAKLSPAKTPKTTVNSKLLSAKERDQLLATLKTRFEANMNRHPSLQWSEVEARLKAKPEKVWSLNEMETTGGEPDVFAHDGDTGEFIFCDFAAESPKGRRSLCYDRAALDARKENKPANCVLDVAASMSVDLLTEQQYRELQQLGACDTKTSSWVQTPPAIRKLGGAIFCDRRYDTVFTYHNGADSYYAARGFRASLRV